MAPISTHDAVTDVWGREYPRVIAGLVRITRDLRLAEDLAQDAFVAALEQWPNSGVPDNPGAWLMTVAKRRAVDHFRRNQRHRAHRDEIRRLTEVREEEQQMSDPDAAVDFIEDDQLRLMFVSCTAGPVAGGAHSATAGWPHHR